MDKQKFHSADASVSPRSWCVEWFGSQGDFIAGKAIEPISLSRFGGLESLYAIGPLERGLGEVSIYDGVPLISEVHDSQTSVSIDFGRSAAFLVYAIVENWRRVTLHKPIDGEQQLEEQLLPFAVESAIDVDQPFPFLVHCHITQATFHVLRNQSEGEYSPELHEKAKVRFPIADESVEVVGFYSRRHRGVFTPRDSDFHMHVRTVDNRLSGHLEGFNLPQGMTIYLPVNER
jgi:acetolactate decarboxylase